MMAGAFGLQRLLKQSGEGAAVDMLVRPASVRVLTA